MTPSGQSSAVRASRVIGTDVYNDRGKAIGRVEDIVLDKRSYAIMFAVIGFGGFLGLGERYHALPWSVLGYESRLGGYVVPYTREQLEAAPASTINELIQDDGRKARDAVHAYYRVPPYWT